MIQNAKWAIFTCAVLAGAFGCDGAMAENQSPSAQPTATAGSSSGATGLEEIVVTAQKRSQSLLDVPITITAITGEDLKAKEFSNITDLPDLVPFLPDLLDDELDIDHAAR